MPAPDGLTKHHQTQVEDDAAEFPRSVRRMGGRNRRNCEACSPVRKFLRMFTRRHQQIIQGCQS
jgi:hypothetical protein